MLHLEWKYFYHLIYHKNKVAEFDILNVVMQKFTKNRYKDKRMCLNTQRYGAYKDNNFGMSLVVIGFDKRLGKCNTT